MREGAETVPMVLSIMITPIVVFDALVNNWAWWQLVKKYTLVDEVWASLLSFIF